MCERCNLGALVCCGFVCVWNKVSYEQKLLKLPLETQFGSKITISTLVCFFELHLFGQMQFDKRKERNCVTSGTWQAASLVGVKVNEFASWIWVSLSLYLSSFQLTWTRKMWQNLLNKMCNKRENFGQQNSQNESSAKFEFWRQTFAKCFDKWHSAKKFDTFSFFHKTHAFCI